MVYHTESLEKFNHVHTDIVRQFNRIESLKKYNHVHIHSVRKYNEIAYNLLTNGVK